MIISAAILGAISGLVSLAVRVTLLDDSPGTGTYRGVNRMWFIGLLLLPLAVTLLYLGFRSILTGVGHAGALAAMIGSAAAAVGNALEFRLGENQGFILFGFGFVIFAGGMVAFGASVRRTSPKQLSIAVTAIGPLGFLATIAGPIGIAASLFFIGAWITVAVYRSSP